MQKFDTILILLLISFVLIGCSTSGYRAVMFIDAIVEGNEQHRRLTIKTFDGNYESVYKISQADKLTIELEIEKGTLEYKLVDPNGDLVYEDTITNDKKQINLEGSFIPGRYRAYFGSKKGENLRMELVFE